MKKIIAIICDNGPIYESYDMGGSETWAIEISKQFAYNDYYVMIFSASNQWISCDNIEYIPISRLENIISHVKIEYTFIFRYIFTQTLDILSKYINNKKVYWICHDIIAMIDNKPVNSERIQNNYWLNTNLNKFICMSAFGKECIKQFIPVSDNQFEIIGNGINFDFINKDNNAEKDNSFLWSSRHERGLKLFAEEIFPIIKEKYPESKIYVAQYTNSLPQEYLDNENIVFLGKLTKEQLYAEMQKHKVYFYPNFFPETFCITILEAILCDCELITKFAHGIQTTLKIFEKELLPSNIEYNNEKCKEIANIIIDKMENYDNINRKSIRNIMKNYIYNEYSWENIYKQFKEKILI